MTSRAPVPQHGLASLQVSFHMLPQDKHSGPGPGECTVFWVGGRVILELVEVNAELGIRNSAP